MALTIALIIVGTVVLVVLELWLFWLLGEHVDRRRLRAECASPDPGEDRVIFVGMGRRSPVRASEGPDRVRPRPCAFRAGRQRMSLELEDAARACARGREGTTPGLPSRAGN